MNQAQLYLAEPSPLCAKVRKVLEFKGIDHTVVEVDPLDREELLKMTGHASVPVLRMDGETIAESTAIALHLERRQPQPTILPAGSVGLHIGLTRYFEGELAASIALAILPDLMERYRKRGRACLQRFRQLIERDHGEGYCERTVADLALNLARLDEDLAPLDETLGTRGFLLNRIGLADFSLYGQLRMLALSGERRISPRLAGLWAFYERMDRITSALETA